MSPLILPHSLPDLLAKAIELQKQAKDYRIVTMLRYGLTELIMSDISRLGKHLGGDEDLTQKLERYFREVLEKQTNENSNYIAKNILTLMTLDSIGRPKRISDYENKISELIDSMTDKTEIEIGLDNDNEMIPYTIGLFRLHCVLKKIYYEYLIPQLIHDTHKPTKDSLKKVLVEIPEQWIKTQSLAYPKFSKLIEDAREISLYGIEAFLMIMLASWFKNYGLSSTGWKKICTPIIVEDLAAFQLNFISLNIYGAVQDKATAMALKADFLRSLHLLSGICVKGLLLLAEGGRPQFVYNFKSDVKRFSKKYKTKKVKEDDLHEDTILEKQTDRDKSVDEDRSDFSSLAADRENRIGKNKDTDSEEIGTGHREGTEEDYDADKIYDQSYIISTGLMKHPGGLTLLSLFALLDVNIDKSGKKIISEQEISETLAILLMILCHYRNEAELSAFCDAVSLTEKQRNLLKGSKSDFFDKFYIDVAIIQGLVLSKYVEYLKHGVLYRIGQDFKNEDDYFNDQTRKEFNQFKEDVEVRYAHLSPEEREGIIKVNWSSKVRLYDAHDRYAPQTLVITEIIDLLTNFPFEEWRKEKMSLKFLLNSVRNKCREKFRKKEAGSSSLSNLPNEIHEGEVAVQNDSNESSNENASWENFIEKHQIIDKEFDEYIKKLLFKIRMTGFGALKLYIQKMDTLDRTEKKVVNAFFDYHFSVDDDAVEESKKNACGLYEALSSDLEMSLGHVRKTISTAMKKLANDTKLHFLLEKLADGEDDIFSAHLK